MNTLYDIRKIHINKDTSKIIVNNFKKIEHNKLNGILYDNVTYNFLGKGGQGTVYEICLLKDKCIAIKRSRIGKNKIENENENTLLIFMSNSVKSFICPNFLLIYDIYTINNYNYIIMEKIDGNLEKWLIFPHNDDEWLSFLFQFLIGIYAMKVYGKTYHSDLKPKNILFKNIDTNNVCIKYSLNLNSKITDYFVPLHNKLFILGDFGHAQSLLLKSNKMSSDEIKYNLSNNSDLTHIYTLPKRLIVDSIVNNYNLSSICDFLEMNNVDYKNYYNKEKEKINIDLKEYPDKIKNIMLLKSLGYFIIENNLYDKLSIKKKSKYYMPSNNIIKLIVDNFDGKLNPEEIITKCFSNYKIKQNDDILIDNYVL